MKSTVGQLLCVYWAADTDRHPNLESAVSMQRQSQRHLINQRYSIVKRSDVYCRQYYLHENIQFGNKTSLVFGAFDFSMSF